MVAERVYIGIDPTAGRRLLTYAVLDSALNVLAIDDTRLEEVLEAVEAHPAALCAVDAPSGPNLSLMAEPAYRQGLGLRPGASRYTSFRVGEYELRRRNIGLYRTPQDAEDAPRWMKLGWRLYEALQEAGYARYPQAGPRQVVEVHPHACFTVLLGHRPYKKNTIEGRLQRQLLLYEEGLNITDPMHLFEEWTRHHVLAGRMALDDLYEHDQLDALVSAYTAYLLSEEPERTTGVGDPAEGTIVVPTASLKERYP
jgi:predicted nuclease with RNAse H fold